MDVSDSIGGSIANCPVAPLPVLAGVSRPVKNYFDEITDRP
jgi:hypothetical protein